MAWISDRYIGDNRIQLGYEEIIRPLVIGTNWQSIRIGVRWCMNDSARSDGRQFAFLMGVCQGSNGLHATSTTDWIGGGIVGTLIPTGITGGVSPTFIAGTPNYFGVGSSENGLIRIGSNTTYGSASGAAFYYVGSGQGGYITAQQMSHAYVDITKTSATSATVISYFPSSAGAVQAACTDVIFKTNMGATTLTNVTAATHTLTYFGSFLWDTFSLAHYKGWPTVEIDAIWISRLL